MSPARPVPVLYVHHRPEVSGAATALAGLLAELDRSRFEPHVYCPPGPACALFRSLGVPVHAGPAAGFTHIWASTYRGRRWAALARELARLPLHVAALRRVLRDQPFALVHLNDSPLLAAAWLAHREGIRVVWHLRSALAGGRRGRLVRGAVRRLGDAAIAVNDDVAASFDVSAEVVHDSADLRRFRPGDGRAEREALGLPPDRPLASFFGYLYPAKGFRELIQAASLLRDRGIEATFLLVGGGVRRTGFFATPAGRLLAVLRLLHDHEREARELVSALSLDDRVHLLPFARDPAPLYRASDVVVAPSQGPEVGLPAIEAAASGVPAVVTGTATGAGVVVPGETAVVAHATPQGLAEAIGALLADPSRRTALGRAARAHAEQRFDPVLNARSVESVYGRALGWSDADVPLVVAGQSATLGYASP